MPSGEFSWGTFSEHVGIRQSQEKHSSDEEGFYKNKLIKLQKVCAKPYKK